MSMQINETKCCQHCCWKWYRYWSDSVVMESSNTQTNPVAIPAQSPTHSSQTGFSYNVCTVLLHCKLRNRKMKSLKRLKNSLLHNQTVRQVRKQSLNTWAGENLHHFRQGGAVVYPFWFGDAFKGTRKLFNPTGRRGWHDFTEHNTLTDESTTNCFRGHIPLSLD